MDITNRTREGLEILSQPRDRLLPVDSPGRQIHHAFLVAKARIDLGAVQDEFVPTEGGKAGA